MRERSFRGVSPACFSRVRQISGDVTNPPNRNVDRRIMGLFRRRLKSKLILVADGIVAHVALRPLNSDFSDVIDDADAAS